MKIPETHYDLLKDETKAFAYLATTMKDGTPQVTPVWFSWDGESILINTAQGRVKDRNMRERPYVALVITDPKNPGRYMQIRGPVVGIELQGAREHIHYLSMKYTGNPVYTFANSDEVRVKYCIQPEHVNVN